MSMMMVMMTIMRIMIIMRIMTMTLQTVRNGVASGDYPGELSSSLGGGKNLKITITTEITMES